MPDELAIINRVIEWHQSIREHVKLIGDSVTDREALSSLQKARADWVPGRLDILVEKQKKLTQAMSALDEGLNNHFGWEEEALPPILGQLFMRALVIEHQEIMRRIGLARTSVTTLEIEGLSRDACLVKEAEMQDMISNLSQSIEGHAHREETILEMAQKALLEKGQAESQG